MAMTVSQFINAVGQDTILSELDVTERNLRHAKSSNRFAAGWYLPLRKLAERRGVHCPESLFNWKRLERGNGSDLETVQPRLVDDSVDNS